VVAIAKRYGIAVADVLRWNKLANADLIRPGDRLRVVELQATAEPARAVTAR
jgi:LysM repeat protein